MPTIMEKEQGETSSPGKSTAPAKQTVGRQNSLSPSGCPFHSGSASEQNGAGSRECVLFFVYTKSVKILNVLQLLAWQCENFYFVLTFQVLIPSRSRTGLSLPHMETRLQ